MSDVLTPDAIIEEVTLAGGDLAKISPEKRKVYVRHKAELYGLNHQMEPFALLTLDGKLTLYVTRAGTDQIRRKENISIKIVAREEHDGMYVVTCQATMPDGRTDEAVGAVPLVERIVAEWKTDARTGRRYPVYDPTGAVRGLDPINRANAVMKAETKSKRRATISIAGLGMLDESELDGFDDELESAPRGRVRESARRPLAPVTPEDTATAKGPEDVPIIQRYTAKGSEDVPDRAALLSIVQRFRALLKLDARSYAELWREHCGEAGPDNADPAALSDLVAVLQKRVTDRGLLL
jgi:hypothetical protein